MLLKYPFLPLETNNQTRETSLDLSASGDKASTVYPLHHPTVDNPANKHESHGKIYKSLLK